MDKDIEEQIKKSELSRDPVNKEFWEAKKTFFDKHYKDLLGQLAEVEFLIGCYTERIKEFDL